MKEAVFMVAILADIIILALILGYCAYLVYGIVKRFKMESSRDVAAAVPDAVDAVVDAAVQILMK